MLITPNGHIYSRYPATTGPTRCSHSLFTYEVIEALSWGLPSPAWYLPKPTKMALEPILFFFLPEQWKKCSSSESLHLCFVCHPFSLSEGNSQYLTGSTSKVSIRQSSRDVKKNNYEKKELFVHLLFGDMVGWVNVDGK